MRKTLKEITFPDAIKVLKHMILFVTYSLRNVFEVRKIFTNAK